MTNADYIRNMTNGELAQFLFEEIDCPPEGKCPVDGCDGSNCKKHLLKWLQEERKAE